MCHKGTIGAKILSYVNVTSGDLNALKIAIAQNGPVAVGIDASHKSFAFYSFGVYYEPQCGTSLVKKCRTISNMEILLKSFQTPVFKKRRRI